ncbi:aspartate/glutamate racemase family protein [Novosphingopyxis sp.]|uniref:aspartate/glutamate racemase family protein n=1 Tax=Novosphingopyxis sp. TaxID=2709690 RepID=UPI003B59D938
MRKIGLIGGMSWVSTETYYRRINSRVQIARGHDFSAPMVVESLDFNGLIRTTDKEAWKQAAEILSDAAKRLEGSGATAILIGANSMHKVYDEVAEAVSVPVIHIADVIGVKMKADGVRSAALIGTRNVMIEPWYRQRLIEHGVSLLPPDMARVDEIDRIIYDELMKGVVKRDAERTLKTFITNIDKTGVKAIVLGCTELDLIVDTNANILPIYDSTKIHADAAVDWILER